MNGKGPDNLTPDDLRVTDWTRNFVARAVLTRARKVEGEEVCSRFISPSSASRSFLSISSSCCEHWMLEEGVCLSKCYFAFADSQSRCSCVRQAGDSSAIPRNSLLPLLHNSISLGSRPHNYDGAHQKRPRPSETLPQRGGEKQPCAHNLQPLRSKEESPQRQTNNSSPLSINYRLLVSTMASEHHHNPRRRYRHSRRSRAWRQ